MTHSSADEGTIVETVPALAGLLFSLATLVQFLDAQVTVGALDWSLDPSLAFVMSLGALVVSFGSSHTRELDEYATWELVTVGVALLIMVIHQITTVGATAVSNNQPTAGLAAFATGVLAWGVIAR